MIQTNVNGMVAGQTITLAEVSVVKKDRSLNVTISGVWHISSSKPSWINYAPNGKEIDSVCIKVSSLEAWDSSLLLFLIEIKAWSKTHNLVCNLAELPARMQALLDNLEHVYDTKASNHHEDSFIHSVGLSTLQAWLNFEGILSFVGEAYLGMLRLPSRLNKFRWKDWMFQIQECGLMSLPIVSLISFLVGLTLAYQAAVELRQFGADIYIADIVGLSVVREMGPMMAAIILAGRTGASFAATIGNMRANEEIDALEVLGISAVDFLVIPRLLALGLMMPLLTLYANCVGILGGMVVAGSVLQIPPSAYWIETQSSIDLTDLCTGLIKATTFGILIGLSGCMRGLQSERSAEGVGKATTSAVVTAILLIIVADSIFAVLFHALGI
jgi:phospholipid/cholesterol/gamma-HCH transport system permease protein